MWEEGKQEYKPKRNVHDELFSKKGYLSEEEALKWLVEYFKTNVGEATKYLLGVDLFPFQEMIVKTMLQKDYVLGILSRGVGKCLIDSNLQTNRGLLDISEVNVGDTIQSKNSKNKIIDKWIEPKTKGYEIKCGKALDSKVHYQHKIYVFDTSDFTHKYVEARDLNSEIHFMPISVTGDWWGNEPLIDGFEYNRNQFYKGKKRDIKIKENGLAYLLGIIVGDGHIGRNDSLISITSEDCFIIDKFLNYFDSPDRKITITDKNGNKDVKELRAYSNKFNQLLKHIGFSSENKLHIPQKVSNSTKQNVVDFISGLFDADGSINQRGNIKKNSKSCNIELYSCSKKMLEQIHCLLLKLGVMSSLSLKLKAGKTVIMGKECNNKDNYRLTISGRKDIRVFSEQIGFKLPRKQEILDNYLNDTKNSRMGESNCYYIPNIAPYLHEKYGFIKGIIRGKGGKHISLERLKKLLELNILDEKDTKTISEALTHNFYYDKIKSIKEDEFETIGITVEKEHNYWGNGIINHNSFQTAIFAGLEALFTPNCKIAILSRSFRQSRMLFQTLEDLSAKPEAGLFAEGMLGRPSHANDAWQMKFDNGSSVIALPLGDGSKLRGFRFNCIIIDELLLMPEKILNEVIMPFLSTNADSAKRVQAMETYRKAIERGIMTEKDLEEIKKTSPLFRKNKMIGLSSASYQFEYLYTIYKEYISKIKNGTDDGEELMKDGSNKLDASYAVFQMSYDIAPEGLYDEALIENQRSQMSKAQFQREFGSQFTDDSSGFFSVSAMERCTAKFGERPCTEIKGDPKDNYVLAVDPNASESDDSDLFAMVLFKLGEEGKMTQVHSYGIAGAKYSEHIRYLLYLLNNFNIKFIIMDNAGGVQFVRACQESQIFKDSGKKIDIIEDVDLSKSGEARGTEIRKFKRLYNEKKGKIIYFQKFTGDWNRESNEDLQFSIDSGLIRWASDLSSIESEFTKAQKQKIGIQNIKFTGDETTDLRGRKIEDDYSKFSKEKSNLAKQTDFIEHQHDLIKLTKRQIAAIEPKMSDSGSTMQFVLPKELKNQKGKNRTRRDLYTAVLMANWGVKAYNEMKEYGDDEDSDWLPEMF
jgi:intein/homing endonuclease